jgi:hypothetical protein
MNMRTKYFVDKDYFVFIYAPIELEKRLIEDDFNEFRKYRFPLGRYKIEVKLPQTDKENAIDRLIRILEEVNANED